MITVSDRDAPAIWSWLLARGGVAVWESLDLSNLGESFTPATRVDGGPVTKPHWRFADAPKEIITDPAQVKVGVDREVIRFKVHLRMGSQGLSVKCTDASSARIRREVEKAGNGAYYTFDHDEQKAVIWAPSKVIPIAEWAKENIKPVAPEQAPVSQLEDATEGRR